jgi:DNA-binding LacI/PurR family transcriptional regulator
LQVSDGARKAVERAAAELGYMPNRGAQSLAAGRCESVGVLVPEPSSGLFGDPLLARLLGAIGEELSASGLQMVLFAPQSATDLLRLEQYLAGGHVDAVLLLALHESDALPARLQASGIPMVFGGRPRGAVQISYVDVDNQAGGRSATEHLVVQGRRRIAHIAGPQNGTAARERFQGFREAMWNAGLRSDLVEHGAFDRDSGELAMARLLATLGDIDAVFAASDAMAAGAMWALQVLGRRVPEDVAVIGYDDSPIATATQPPLSSVRQPVEDMGREMAKLVLNLSTARVQSPRRMILGPELALRESTVGSPN